MSEKNGAMRALEERLGGSGQGRGSGGLGARNGGPGRAI